MNSKLILCVMFYMIFYVSFSQEIQYFNVVTPGNLLVQGNNYNTLLFSTPDNAPYRLNFINDTFTADNHICKSVYVDNNTTNSQKVQILQLIFLLSRASSFAVDGYASGSLLQYQYCHIIEAQISNA